MPFYIPPGIPFIVQSLPSTLAPVGIAYVLVSSGSQHYGLNLPTWVHIIAALALQPVYILSRRTIDSINNRRKARAYGAELPAMVQESSITLLRRMQATAKNGYLGDVQYPLMEKHGNSYMFELFGDKFLFTLEPEHIKTILATQFTEFGKGPDLYHAWKDFLGTGVFNSDGEPWKTHRTMTRPFFSKDRISDFDNFDARASVAIALMKQRQAEGYAVDFQDVAARFTLDSASQFLFGMNIDSLGAGTVYPDGSPLANSPEFVNHPSNKFVKAFTEGLDALAHRARNRNIWPVFEFWKDQVKPRRAIIDETLKPLLDAAFEKKRLGETVDKDDPDSMSLLASLAQYTEDPVTIMDEIINILIAGRDTTSATLAISVYMLSQRPDIMQRLRKEVLERVGKENRPTYENIRDMKYLRAFLNEVLRLYPIVPGDARSSFVDTTIPNKTTGRKPYFIPKNTQVFYSVFLMHRRKDLWGPDADIFDPDRFIDERLKRLTSNPFMFLPFNAGPRICLGQQFAYNEMSFFLIRLLQQFSGVEFAEDFQPANSRTPEEWKSCPGTKGTDKVRFSIMLTMSIKGGLWVRLKEADDA